MDWPECKLQVCKFFLIEFAPPEWQNVFYIKCQKRFTFANGYLLLFQLLSLQKKRLRDRHHFKQNNLIGPSIRKNHCLIRKYPIFCYFDFYQCRRNDLRTTDNPNERPIYQNPHHAFCLRMSVVRVCLKLHKGAKFQGICRQQPPNFLHPTNSHKQYLIIAL